jgi:hypothetical protein
VVISQAESKVRGSGKKAKHSLELRLATPDDASKGNATPDPAVGEVRGRARLTSPPFQIVVGRVVKVAVTFAVLVLPGKRAGRVHICDASDDLEDEAVMKYTLPFPYHFLTISSSRFKVGEFVRAVVVAVTQPEGNSDNEDKAEQRSRIELSTRKSVLKGKAGPSSIVTSFDNVKVDKVSPSRRSFS